MLATISEYLELQCRLIYVDLWYNLPVRCDQPSISSEHWHRDHEDRQVIKVFVYLEDIDEAMGPFTYLNGTQYGGPHGDIFPSQAALGNYPKEAKLEETISTRNISITECTGRSGSVVLCDASGFHKGGRSSTKPRVVLVGIYTSNAGLDTKSYTLADTAQYHSLSPAQRYALG